MMIPKPTRATLSLLLVVTLRTAVVCAQDAPASPEEERNISYGAEADFGSAFVWRGIVLDDRPVFQPSARIGTSGVTLTVWRNFALTSSPDTRGLALTDLNLAYDRDWKRFEFEPAIDAFLNSPSPGLHDPNTMESSLKLSYQRGPFHVFTRHAFDVLAYRGSYFGEAGVGYERQVRRKGALAVSFRSGWASSKFNSTYIGVARPALNFIGADGSFTYHLTPHLYLQPHLEFTNIVDPALRASLPWPTFLNFRLALGADF